MKKSIVLIAAFAAVATAMTGCLFSTPRLESALRAKPEKLSGFLPHQELLAAQHQNFPFHYFYMKPYAGTYENVYIAPVNMKYLRKNKNWAKLDQKMAEKIGSDINQLADFMRNEYKQAFFKMKGPKTLKVVDAPTGNKTLIVETAIISIVPSKAELTILGTAANLFLPGIGAVANAAAAGSITIECIIRDAKTKEIVAMYANTECDQRAILNIAGMRWYTSAKNNITIQADNTARVFSGNDYSYTWRKVIKIIQL